jgi:hypothetical protein
MKELLIHMIQTILKEPEVTVNAADIAKINGSKKHLLGENLQL